MQTTFERRLQVGLLKILNQIFTTAAFLLLAVSLSAQEKTIKAGEKTATVTAQLSDTQNMITTDLKPIEVSDKKFSILAGFEFSQKIAADERSDRESGTDLLIAPSYKISETFILGAKTILSKSNAGTQDTTLSNSTLSLSIKGVQLTPKLLSLHSVSFVAPTNNESQKNDRFQTSVGVSNGFRLQLVYAKIDYRLGIAKNIHEFTQNAEGSPNVEYRLTQTVDLSIPVTEKLSVTSVAVYRQGWTYRGFQRFAFEWHNDLNLDVTANLAVNVGISNDGSALKANGVDSNISAYSPDSSVTRAGLSYTY